MGRIYPSIPDAGVGSTPRWTEPASGLISCAVKNVQKRTTRAAHESGTNPSVRLLVAPPRGKSKVRVASSSGCFLEAP